MTNSLGDILANKWDEPPEIKIIKDYVKDNLDASVGVEQRPNRIIISVSSGAMASALRVHLYKIQKLLETDKKLVIKIG